MDTAALPWTDGGSAPAATHFAFDRAWLAAAARGEPAEGLRFHVCEPAVSVGRHQALAREIRLEHCQRHGLPVLRRASGGGALYHDGGQLGFSLVLARPRRFAGLALADILARFAAAVALALRELGIATAFKAPNDLEADGRKLASIFAAQEGEALLLHGTVLLEADVPAMLAALRVPTEKLSADGLAAARDRLAPLAPLLGARPDAAALRNVLAAALARILGMPFIPGVLPDPPAVPAPAGPDWAEDGGWEALWRAPGGVLRVRLELAEGRCTRAGFALDTPCVPTDLPVRLAAALAGRRTDELAQAAVGAAAGGEMVGATPEDIAQVVRLALEKAAARDSLDLEPSQANALMLQPARGLTSAAAILARAGAVLVPYCAKPAWCDWRHRDGCAECGKCAVGDAYRLGREAGLSVHTVTRFEHLRTVLGELRERGEEAYVGMCCGHFFLKRHHAFREADMAALLMDIHGANCYELGEEGAAYAGAFRAEAALDADALRKTLGRIAHLRQTAHPAGE